MTDDSGARPDDGRAPSLYGDECMFGWVVNHDDLFIPVTEHPPLPSTESPTTIAGLVPIRHRPVPRTLSERRKYVGLPPGPFLYTLDQIESLIQTSTGVAVDHLHFSGITPGIQKKDKMLAINLGRNGEPPDWRVADAEFVRWLRFKGFQVYDAWGLSLDE